MLSGSILRLKLQKTNNHDSRIRLCPRWHVSRLIQHNLKTSLTCVLSQSMICSGGLFRKRPGTMHPENTLLSMALSPIHTCCRGTSLSARVWAQLTTLAAPSSLISLSDRSKYLREMFALRPWLRAIVPVFFNLLPLMHKNSRAHGGRARASPITSPSFSDRAE